MVDNVSIPGMSSWTKAAAVVPYVGPLVCSYVKDKLVSINTGEHQSEVLAIFRQYTKIERWNTSLTAIATVALCALGFYVGILLLPQAAIIAGCALLYNAICFASTRIPHRQKEIKNVTTHDDAYKKEQAISEPLDAGVKIEHVKPRQDIDMLQGQIEQLKSQDRLIMDDDEEDDFDAMQSADIPMQYTELKQVLEKLGTEKKALVLKGFAERSKTLAEVVARALTQDKEKRTLPYESAMKQFKQINNELFSSEEGSLNYFDLHGVLKTAYEALFEAHNALHHEIDKLNPVPSPQYL